MTRRERKLERAAELRRAHTNSAAPVPALPLIATAFPIATGQPGQTPPLVSSPFSWNLFWTVVTAVSTVVYSVFSILLWKAAVRQWREVAQTNNIAISNQKQTLQPWLDLESISPPKNDESLDEILWQARIKNFGPSPALAVKANLSLYRPPELERSELPRLLSTELHNLTPQESDSGLVVQAGQSLVKAGTTKGRISVKDQSLTYFLSGSLFMLVNITYLDQFGKEHHTRTCRKWQASEQFEGCPLSDFAD